MKTLLIGDYPPPLGGVAVHVQQLRSRLLREGLEVRTLDIGQGRYERSKDAEGPLDIEGVQGATDFVTRLDRHGREGFLFHLHTSGNNPKAWTVAGVVSAVAKLRGVPAIITVHSGMLPQLLEQSGVMRTLARAALASYDAIIPVSEPVKQGLLSVGVSEERMVVVPAFLPSEVEPGELPDSLADALQARRPLLACAHHPSPIYGRETFFKALALLRKEHPTMVAAVFGPGTLDPEFQADARRLGVSDALLPLGEMPHDEALAVMCLADVFVRPTTVDGDAVSVREALTLGVPCVASDAAPRPEGCEVFLTSDAASLAAAVGKALQLPRATLQQPDAGRHLLAIYRLLSATSGRPWTPATDSVGAHT